MRLKPKTGRIAAALAMVAAGVLAMGAGRAPATAEVKAAEVEAAMAKIFATPRLYRMTMSAVGPVRAREGLEMCVGAELLRDLMRGAQRSPGAAGSTGCVLTHERRAGGGFRFERTCDRTRGASATSHAVMEGTVKDIRQHMEIVVESAQSDEPRILATDAHMVEAGPCPAPMKPGQFRTPNGEIRDLPALPAGPAR